MTQQAKVRKPSDYKEGGMHIRACRGPVTNQPLCAVTTDGLVWLNTDRCRRIAKFYEQAAAWSRQEEGK